MTLPSTSWIISGFSCLQSPAQLLTNTWWNIDCNVLPCNLLQHFAVQWYYELRLRLLDMVFIRLHLFTPPASGAIPQESMYIFLTRIVLTLFLRSAHNPLVLNPGRRRWWCMRAEDAGYSYVRTRSASCLHTLVIKRAMGDALGGWSNGATATAWHFNLRPLLDRCNK